MSPILTYTLARFGLFAAVATVLLVVPFDVSPLLKLMIAVLVSVPLSFVLLRRLRERVNLQTADYLERRTEKRERLRAALNGDDDGGADATRAG